MRFGVRNSLKAENIVHVGVRAHLVAPCSDAQMCGQVYKVRCGTNGPEMFLVINWACLHRSTSIHVEATSNDQMAKNSASFFC